MNVVVSYAAMALVAERRDGRHVQQAGVLGTVRRMASQTPLGLDRDVFKDERPARLGVALGADRVLVGRGLQVVGAEGAVHVVAVAARDQAFVHLVVERHIECRLGVGVALEAELRLRNLQQVFFFVALMNAVAADTADVRPGVGRAVKVRVRSRMTGQALGVDLFRRSVLERIDLAHVAATRHVVRARTMAALAPLFRGPALLIQRSLQVRSFLPRVISLLMAGFARFRANILGGFGRRRAGPSHAGGLSGPGLATLVGDRMTNLAQSRSGDTKGQERD